MNSAPEGGLNNKLQYAIHALDGINHGITAALGNPQRHHADANLLHAEPSQRRVDRKFGGIRRRAVIFFLCPGAESIRPRALKISALNFPTSSQPKDEPYIFK